MKIVYATRSGHTKKLVTEKLGFSDSIEINMSTPDMKEDFLLFTYTDGQGIVPSKTKNFLVKNSKYLKGVVACGSLLRHNETFAQSGDKIAKEYNVPLIRKVDVEGEDTDYRVIKEWLANN